MAYLAGTLELQVEGLGARDVAAGRLGVVVGGEVDDVLDLALVLLGDLQAPEPPGEMGFK